MTFDLTLIEILFGVLALIAGIYGLRNVRLHRNFLRDVDLRVNTDFYDSTISHDQYRRGSVKLELHGSKQKLLTLTITSMSFSESAFQIPSMDKLYFKAQDERKQALSLSFRVEKEYLKHFGNRRVYLLVSGKYTDREGVVKQFKAKLPQHILSTSNFSDAALLMES